MTNKEITNFSITFEASLEDFKGKKFISSKWDYDEAIFRVYKDISFMDDGGAMAKWNVLINKVQTLLLAKYSMFPTNKIDFGGLVKASGIITDKKFIGEYYSPKYAKYYLEDIEAMERNVVEAIIDNINGEKYSLKILERLLVK